MSSYSTSSNGRWPFGQHSSIDRQSTLPLNRHTSVHVDRDWRVGFNGHSWQGALGVVGLGLLISNLPATGARAKDELRAEREQREAGVEPDHNITDEMVAAARGDIGYREGKKNIIVTGNQGVGKSSLINALRGKRNCEEGAAAVGVTETTSTTTRYEDCGHPDIVLFDCPGAGTKQTSGWQYYRNQRLYAYDTVVVVYNSALREIDQTIQMRCRERDQNCIFVRSKADVDILHCLEDLEDNNSKEQAARDHFLTKVAPARGINLQPDSTNDSRTYVVTTKTLLRHRHGQGTVATNPRFDTIDEEALLQKLGIDPPSQ